MLRNWKIFFQFILLLISVNSFGQRDSIKKQQVFLSFNMGLPLYNQFTYIIDEQPETLTSFSIPKLSFNFNFEHNINRFTINALYNYSQNEFTGNSFIINGKSLGTAPHSPTIYKHLEIYQKIKYTYLQIGIGIGYNHWIKKHNISLTTNIHQSLFSKITMDVYYVKNSPYNDQDTTAVNLARNKKISDISELNPPMLYASFKLMYTYMINKHFYVSLSTSPSAGFLNLHSSTQSSYNGSQSLAYGILYQKMIYINSGIRYKLF